MDEKILTVRTQEFEEIIGLRPFKALPQEEIDRLYGSIEVNMTEHTLAEQNPSLLQLMVVTAFHYNYSWLISSGEINEKKTETTLSMCFVNHIQSDGYDDIFLDESIKRVASSTANHHIDIASAYDLRLAGLLLDKLHLGLVYIFRLRQPGVIDRRNGEATIRFCGTGEIQQNRDRFDSWSRVLIDHLDAF